MICDGSPFQRAADGRAARRAWLITFTDLVSLLLAFFVLLFSMRNVETEGWQTTVDSLTRSLNPGYHVTQHPSAAALSVESVEKQRALDLDYLSMVLKETLSDDPVSTRMVVSRDGEGLVIALPTDALFATGRTIPSQEARRALFALGGILRHIGNGIAIRAYADPPPVPGIAYASDWGSALSRAQAIASVLRDSGYTRPMRLYAYAASDTKETAAQNSEQSAKVKQGVDVVILEDEAPR